VPVSGSVRERRRAETVGEIKTAALEQLAETGAPGLSLRAVARAVGMTVQSLYHYFDSRDALLTALVVDGHRAVADAVQAAVDATRGRPPLQRRLAATGAYRSWAQQNREAFLLLYGTPVPGFTPSAPEDNAAAALRLGPPFAEVVFDGWSPAQLAALPLPPGGAELAGVDDLGFGLPPGALALFIELRAHMHGLVVLELLGHLHPFVDRGEALFTGAMHRMSDQLDALAAQSSPVR
jgi:AcrR family transcriptional regulator